MKKSLFRIVFKSCLFQSSQTAPSFKLKVGKTDKAVNPFCFSGTEQHYNHEMILEKAAETDATIDCIIKDKVVASGKLLFDDKKQEQKIELADSKKKKIGTLSISLKKIDKRPKSYIFKAEVYSGEFELKMDKVNPYLLLKMGDTHIKTKTADHGLKQPQWNQTFDMKSVDEEFVCVQAWGEDIKNSIFIGSVTFKIQEAINRKSSYDILDKEAKKIGHVLIRLYEEGHGEPGEIEINDKNILPMKNLKMYVLEAILKADSTLKRDTYIRIEVEGQKTQTTTSIFSEGRNPKWNQSFNLALNPQSNAPIKLCLCQKDDKGVEHVIGTSILDPSTIENKQYELAFKSSTNAELGKLYMECEADWIEKNTHRSYYDEPQQPLQLKKKQELPKVKSGVNSYKSAAGGDNEQLSKRIKQIKDKYSTKTSLHEYFYNQLNSVLEEGLLKISRQKPADPIRELGLFLINYQRK